MVLEVFSGPILQGRMCWMCGVDLGSACIPSGSATDQATAPGLAGINQSFLHWYCDTNYSVLFCCSYDCFMSFQYEGESICNDHVLINRKALNLHTL